jgi:hypothetical protein
VNVFSTTTLDASGFCYEFIVVALACLHYVCNSHCTNLSQGRMWLSAVMFHTLLIVSSDMRLCFINTSRHHIHDLILFNGA